MQFNLRTIALHLSGRKEKKKEKKTSLQDSMSYYLLNGLEPLMVPKSQQFVCLWCILPQTLILHAFSSQPEVSANKPAQGGVCVCVCVCWGGYNLVHEAVYIRNTVISSSYLPNTIIPYRHNPKDSSRGKNKAHVCIIVPLYRGPTELECFQVMVKISEFWD